ncbi:MAG: hypothetical protein KKB31_03075 [Nanoarchaeota archaeon]|nr:hypothetical protein [Nanoarchaeota archaeon]
MGKTLKSRLMPLTTAVILTTSLLCPRTAHTIDEGYSEYSPPSRIEIQEVLSQNNFPDSFSFYYEIVPNKKGFTGNVRLTRSKDKTDLRIRMISPSADKYFNFYEERKGDSVYYHESEFDYPQGRFLYDTTFVYPINDKPTTLVSLIERVSVAKIPNTSFVFQGDSEKMRKYKLKISSNAETGFDLELKGEVGKNSPRIPWVMAFYEDVNGLKIPTEIWVAYKVKIFDTGIFGSIYVTPRLIGTLQIPKKE